MKNKELPLTLNLGLFDDLNSEIICLSLQSFKVKNQASKGQMENKHSFQIMVIKEVQDVS